MCFYMCSILPKCSARNCAKPVFSCYSCPFSLSALDLGVWAIHPLNVEAPTTAPTVTTITCYCCCGHSDSWQARLLGPCWQSLCVALLFSSPPGSGEATLFPGPRGVADSAPVLTDTVGLFFHATWSPVWVYPWGWYLITSAGWVDFISVESCCDTLVRKYFYYLRSLLPNC